MQFSSLWRRNQVPAKSRLTQFRAILRAAQSVEGYSDGLRHAGLNSPDSLKNIRDVEETLLALPPMPLIKYKSLFKQRKPAWRQVPHSQETRSALMLPYPEARKGVDVCHPTTPERADLYSTGGIASATADLYNLSKALSAPAPFAWTVDHALVVFCGIDAGVMTDAQHEDLWEKYQIPVFQQFVGTDGRVVAAECEVHAGLHIRADAAVFECVDNELVMTSLTDEQSPALRMQSGLCGVIEREACECGRGEPRIVGLRSMARPQATVAVA